jgi:hypothetical protein
MTKLAAIPPVKARRFFLTLIAVALGVAVAMAWRRFRPAPKMNPPMAIQDSATIDFSSGKPVVKDSAQEKAIIDAAVKEMDDAVKGVAFTPTAPAPTPAAPTPAAPPTPAAGAGSPPK